MCREVSKKSPRAFWAFRRLGYQKLVDLEAWSSISGDTYGLDSVKFQEGCIVFPWDRKNFPNSGERVMTFTD
ncbi:hypothetical protein ACET3Z_009957 [Daucus carota]